MPRFFFSLTDGDFYADEEGQELPSAAEAREVAMAAAREIMADEVRAGQLNLEDKITISDSGGQVVTTISFRDALRITRE